MSLSLTDVPQPLGKVAIVTGANSGLGFQTAKSLADLGCTVILACRSDRRAHAAIEDIQKCLREEGRMEAADLRFMCLDLGSLQSVRDFCEQFRRSGLPLHILVCNAAVLGIPQSFTVDGYETQFQVNYLSHFLLTILLLPVMMKSGPDCRVINVSAKLHRISSFEIDNIQGEKSYKRIGFYNKSKLYQIMNMYALQRRISDSEVAIHSLHPGVIDSNLQTGLLDNTWTGWFFFALRVVFSLPPVRYLIYKTGIMQTADMAANSVVYMAVSPKLAGQKTIFFDQTVPRATSSQSRNEEDQERLVGYSISCIRKFVPDDILQRLHLKDI